MPAINQSSLQLCKYLSGQFCQMANLTIIFSNLVYPYLYINRRHGVSSIPELELTLNSILELEFIFRKSFGIGIYFVGIIDLILLIFTP